MAEEGWERSNLAAIEGRLAWLAGAPDGVLHEERTALHYIRVVKHTRQVQLYFVEPDGALAGPMSRIDLDRPLHLLAHYTQAAALALLWAPEPRHVAVLGFGGGRLPLVLHHHLPGAVIDSVDIDAAFGPVAERFFGVAFDARQRLFVRDARAFLEAPPAPAYDVVVMDAFRDSSDNLDHLATREFYALCRRRMAPSAVLCANLLRSDPRFDAKLATFRAGFRHTYTVEQRRSLVLFGTNRAPLPQRALLPRARELQRRHGFDFPLLEQAALLAHDRGGAVRNRSAGLLSDG
jgi:spermidine synthase